MPIKDCEMRRESESSEEQKQLQSGDDRKCPRYAASHPETHCNREQSCFPAVSLTASARTPYVSVDPFSRRGDVLSPPNLPRSSIVCCFPPSRKHFR